MDGKVATPDAMVAEIAERQHGVVSVGQLRCSGLSDDAIRGRTLAGRLHRVHRGVYAVGHAGLSMEGRCLAGVLAVGGGPLGEAASVFGYWNAAVSHRSAAWLWGLLPAAQASVDVIASGLSGKAKRRGVRLHRSRSLLPAEVTLCRRVPVTTPARTISDLRRAQAGRPGAVSPRELRKAIRQADVLGLSIGDDSAGDHTRSDLERDFLRLCRRHGLPSPEVNVRIGRYRVDFLWRKRRLVVETDGYVYHRGRVAFQDDRGRDLELRRLGFEVMRLSERQVDEDPSRVVETLVGMLDGRRRG